MKKKVNYYKIGALIFMLIDLGIAIWVDKGVAKENLLVWRAYVACIMAIPINFMFICTKQTRKEKKHA